MTLWNLHKKAPQRLLLSKRLNSFVSQRILEMDLPRIGGKHFVIQHSNFLQHYCQKSGNTRPYCPLGQQTAWSPPELSSLNGVKLNNKKEVHLTYSWWFSSPYVTLYLTFERKLPPGMHPVKKKAKKKKSPTAGKSWHDRIFYSAYLVLNGSFRWIAVFGNTVMTTTPPPHFFLKDCTYDAFMYVTAVKHVPMCIATVKLIAADAQ